MRVGLDLLYLVPGETGGRETYARELVPALLELLPELELVAFVNRDAGRRLALELGDGVGAVVVPVSARSRPQWAIGELALVSAAAQRARVEVLHSMANFAPAWGRFRRVVTIHDLQYRAVPELLSWPTRAATSALVSLGARAADRIIAVSASGREEMVPPAWGSGENGSTSSRTACVLRRSPPRPSACANAIGSGSVRSRSPWRPTSPTRTSRR